MTSPIDTDDGAPAARKTVIETDRLLLCELTPDDAPFILSLVNEPSWLRYIGDRGVRTLDDARAYIRSGPMATIAQFGYGLWQVRRRSDDAAMGLCGLLKRDALDAPDIGFAFSPAYWGKGYAREAAQATLDQARDAFGLTRILAIVSPANASSIQLLEGLGMCATSRIRLSEDADEVILYAAQ